MISNKRIVLVLIFFVASLLSIRLCEKILAVPIKRPLSEFPESFGKWKLTQKRSLSPEVKEMLGADDYIDYTFTDGNGNRVDLYVSYFSNIGVNGAYHSPKNCLPGGGWNILATDKVSIKGAQDREVEINKMIIAKGESKQLVLYWFQNRGRIIASEYWDKIYTVIDSVMMRRRDGAFIRVMSPNNDVELLRTFSQSATDTLQEYLPGR